MISQLLHDLAVWLGGFGYWGVFIACFGIFPAEIVIAALAALKPNNLIEISLVAALGEVAGAVFPFLVGSYFYKKDILSFLEKRGKLINVSKDSYQKGYSSFKKNGVIYLFFARFIPWIRVAATLVAGYVRYNFVVFSITVFVPTFIYAYGFAYMGSKIGFDWERISNAINTVNNSLVLMTLVIIGIILYLNRKKVKEWVKRVFKGKDEKK